MRIRAKMKNEMAKEIEEKLLGVWEAEGSRVNGTG